MATATPSTPTMTIVDVRSFAPSRLAECSMGTATARTTPANDTPMITSIITLSRSFMRLSPRKHEAADELPHVLLRSDGPFPFAQLVDKEPVPPVVRGRVDIARLVLCD